jgi:hypothetical protein
MGLEEASVLSEGEGSDGGGDWMASDSLPEGHAVLRLEELGEPLL